MGRNDKEIHEEIKLDFIRTFLRGSTLDKLNQKYRTIIENSMKTLTLENIDFMRNLLELNNKAFISTENNLFQANKRNMYPTIAHSKKRLWTKLPEKHEKRSQKFKEAVEEEKK